MLSSVLLPHFLPLILPLPVLWMKDCELTWTQDLFTQTAESFATDEMKNEKKMLGSYALSPEVWKNVNEATFSYPGFLVSPYEVENCSFQVCEELSWYFDEDCIKSVDSFCRIALARTSSTILNRNVPCIPTLSKGLHHEGVLDFVECFFSI
ncbi:hypothetical protein STEG23_002796 [Scotinomys teguina]